MDELDFYSSDAGLNSSMLWCWLNYGKFGRYAALLLASRRHVTEMEMNQRREPSRPFRDARLDRIRTL